MLQFRQQQTAAKCSDLYYNSSDICIFASTLNMYHAMTSHFAKYNLVALMFGGGGVVVRVSDLGSKGLGFDPLAVPKK